MTRRLIAAATIVLFLTALVGCETMSQDEKATMGGLGAGAAVGTLAGLAFGQGAGIAIAGGMIGAAAGGIIGHYAFGKNEDHNKTAQDYNYKPSIGTLLELEGIQITPAQIRPGGRVDIKMSYAVLAPRPNGPINVTEIREIKYKGRVVGEPTVNVTRDGGTYTSSVPITLPSNAIPGTYDVKVTVRTAQESDSMQTSFEVGS